MSEELNADILIGGTVGDAAPVNIDVEAVVVEGGAAAIVTVFASSNRDSVMRRAVPGVLISIITEPLLAPAVLVGLTIVVLDFGRVRGLSNSK
jgi:hypothetical protein